MVRVKIKSPLPNMLGMSDDLKSIIIDLPQLSRQTADNIFPALADADSRFAAYLADKGTSLLENLLISVDGVIIDRAEQKSQTFTADSAVTIFMPYSGG